MNLNYKTTFEVTETNRHLCVIKLKNTEFAGLSITPETAQHKAEHLLEKHLKKCRERMSNFPN